MNFPADRYPVTARYLDSLPNGLDSYPECLARTDARDNVKREFPEIGNDSDLPPIIGDFFHNRYKDNWIPEVVGGALLLLARDVGFKSDDDFLAWCYKGHSSLYLKPHYKIIIYILSPTLLLSGATSRWSTFHRGSTLTPQPIVKQGNFFQGYATLTFPSRLFNELLLRVQRGAYQAAIDATRVKESQILLTEITDTSASLSFRWSANG